MKLTRIKTTGLGREDHDLQIPPVAVIVGPSGAGKSHLLSAVELGVTGGISGSAWVKVPQTSDGVMLFSPSKSLSVSLSGTSDEHGNWSLTRGYTEKLVEPTEAARKKGAVSTLRVVESVEQSFVGTRTATEASAAIAQNMSTLPEVWDIRKLTSKSSGEQRKAFLGRLMEAGDLSRWLPDGLPDDLRKPELLSLAPEPWVRRCLEIVRAKAREHESEAKKHLGVIELSASGQERDTSALASERDRLVAQLGALDAAERRAADLQRAQSEYEAARDEFAECRVPDHSPDKLAKLRAEAERRRRLEDELAGIEISDEVLPTDAEIDAARKAAQDEAANELAIVDATRRKVELSNRVAALRAEYAQAGVAPVDCPHCKRPINSDEVERGEREHARIQAAAKLAKDDLALCESRIRPISTAARDELRRLESAVKRGAGRRAIELRLLAIGDELATLTTISLDQIQVDELAHKALAKAQQRVARAEAELRGLSVGSGESVTGDRSELVQKIEALRIQLRVAQDHNAEVRARKLAEASIADSRASARKWTQWESRLLDIQRDMLASCLEAIVKPLRELTGYDVSISLQNERGAEDFRFLIAGRGSSVTLSGGEHLLFVAGLIGASYQVTSADKCRWRPLILDRIESISKDERDRFISRVKEYVGSGVFDQALLAGCPDTLPSSIRKPILMRGRP